MAPWGRQPGSCQLKKEERNPGDFQWTIPRTLTTVCMNQKDRRLYQLLLGYVPSKDQLENLGFPMGTPTCTTVYQQAYHWFEQGKKENERPCARCKTTIVVSADFKYEGEEKCYYHWGRCAPNKSYKLLMTCCNDIPTSRGCAVGSSHVWSGFAVGPNGPYNGYLEPPKALKNSASTRRRIIGLDCEMCYSITGMEIVRVSLVDVDGTVVYDSLVLPVNRVLDYNTRFSGVSEEDYEKKTAKNFDEVRNELLKFIKRDTILIGHGLENDLRALKFLHFYVVDTSILYLQGEDFPKRRRSLKSIAMEELGVMIQQGEGTTGHDSVEDSTICMQLVLQKLRQDHNVSVVTKKSK